MKRIMGITLIIIGAVCLTTGILFLVQPTKEVKVVCQHHENQPIPHSVEQPQEEPTPSEEPSKQSEAKPAVSPTETKRTRPEEIGQAFENFVVNLLADSRFTLLDRTQDTKSTAGVYAESCKNPDLHIEQTHTPRSIDYYIECKYRSRWHEGKVQLEDYQVKRYKEFQGKHHRKVLFALGIGGTPAAPQTLMIVPLDQLNQGAILESSQEQFKIAPTSEALYAYIDSYFTQVFTAKKK